VKLIGIVAAVIVVLFVAFKLLFGGGGGPEKSATKFVDSIFKGDGKAIVNMIPDKVVEEIMDEEDMTKKEMIEELNDGLEYIKDDMDDMYDKWSVKCKVLDTEDFSKRELRDLADRYEDSYDIDVKAAKTVSVKATLKADGETDSNTMDIVMIKVGGKWYLEYSSINRYF
jgi:hypothetical protein